LALQDGIDGDGGAVEEQSGRFVVAARLRHPGIDPLDQALRPRQRLAEGQLAGALVEGRDIGEGAADVGGEPKARTVGCRWDALLHLPVGDDCTLRAPRTPMRPLSPARDRGQGLASSAAEAETMLAGTVQEKHAWGGRSVRFIRRNCRLSGVRGALICPPATGPRVPLPPAQIPFAGALTV